jgi:RHS repeat-associated protein
MTYAGNSFMAYNFAYDANNRMTGVTDSNSRSIQYQYNLLGNRTTMITPENRTITYAYDAARRLTAITADSHIFSLNYDATGRRTGLSYPNNTAAAYTYDYNGNLTRLRHTGTGGTTLADINYTYDNINNRLTRTDTATYSSDPASNETMSYDAANELLNVNAATYTYDLNGNRTQKIDGSTSTAYTYDDENRLVRVEITSGTTTVITYAYDPFGRRIEKNVNGTITRYLYDKQAVILEYNQAGTVQTRYTHGPGIDEPLAMEKDSLMYYYHADGLGSIIALTNTSGGVAQRYNYDAFGNITSGAPTVTQPYTYTAREYDPETGLYFYRTRYYDSKTGRFLQRDPIGFDGGDYNLYAYVQNNSVNWIDPEGLSEDYPSYSLNDFINGFKLGWQSGYYTCYAKCVAGPFGLSALAHLASEFGGGEALGGLSAKTYLHYTDGRFKAWGKYSKVIMPTVSEKITSYIKFSFTALLAFEAWHCISKCMNCLEPNHSSDCDCQ